MALDMRIFKEPLGMIKIIELVIAILAFVTTAAYKNELKFDCGTNSYLLTFDYPFNLQYSQLMCSKHVKIIGNFSSDARFYVAAGVMTMTYSLFMILIHAYFDENYKANPVYAFFDFGFTLLFSILWLSSTAAWSNGVSGLKNTTDPKLMLEMLKINCCDIKIGSFFILHMSILIGFLNFFVWGVNMWFVYKETTWFYQITHRGGNPTS